MGVMMMENVSVNKNASCGFSFDNSGIIIGANINLLALLIINIIIQLLLRTFW